MIRLRTKLALWLHKACRYLDCRVCRCDVDVYDHYIPVESISSRIQECCGLKIKVYYACTAPGGQCPKCKTWYWYYYLRCTDCDKAAVTSRRNLDGSYTSIPVCHDHKN